MLLTVAGGIPWEPGSGGTPPIRVWTTADWGSSWSRGGLLPLGRDSLAGTASFTPAGGLVPGVGWSGWLVVDTAAFAQHVAVADGGPLRLLPASLNANNVQLLGHGTGFAWGLEDRGGSGRSTLALSRTTDGGHSWRHSSTTLVARLQRRQPRLARLRRRHLAHVRRRHPLDPRLTRSAAGAEIRATRTGCPGLAAGRRTHWNHALRSRGA
jgi:hypothetical protein